MGGRRGHGNKRGPEKGIRCPLLLLRGDWKNALFTLSFFFSLAYFFWQHYLFGSWDFEVYLLNAKYWAGQARYFEIMRLPLASLLLLIYGLSFGWDLAPVAYIIASAVLFMVSIRVLARVLGMDYRVLYPLVVLNPLFLSYATLEGTELLSVSIVLLYIALWSRDRNTGALGGLAFLTRYNNAPIVLLEVFRRDWKKAFSSVAAFSLVVLPWLAYNQYNYGNPLASVIDNYALNVYFRRMHYTYEKNPLMLFSPFGPFVLLALVGVYQLYKKRVTRAQKRAWAGLFLVALVAVATYWLPPKPVERYLLPATVLVGVLSYLGIEKIGSLSRETSARIVMALVILGAVLSIPTRAPILPFAMANPEYSDSGIVSEMVGAIEREGIGNCSMVSNFWVYLDARGYSAVPPPWMEESFRKYLEDGYYGVFFLGVDDPEYTTRLTQGYGVVYESRNVVIVAPYTRECKPPVTWDVSFLDGVATNLDLAGIPHDYDYCRVGFEKIGLVEECRSIEKILARVLPPRKREVPVALS